MFSIASRGTIGYSLLVRVGIRVVSHQFHLNLPLSRMRKTTASVWLRMRDSEGEREKLKAGSLNLETSMST